MDHGGGGVLHSEVISSSAFNLFHAGAEISDLSTARSPTASECF